MTPLRFFHKARHRLARELRHAFAYARARAADTTLTGEDLVPAWRGMPREADADRCVAEWLAAPSPPFATDLEDDPGALRAADAVLRGSVTIFGEPCALALPALWHRDPRTGAAWLADVHFTRFKVFHPARDGVTDIRRLWEVGRFGWALPLARAWHATGREEYAAAWAHYARDFLVHNPPEFGPHWLNAMEPALRAIQWCRALALLAARPGFTGLAPLLREMLPSLLAHGRFIRSHLEWTPYGRTNHFLANLAGLFVLAAFTPQFRDADDWREASAQTLLREMTIQTDSDGFHAEASTAYHRFVLEIYRLVEQAAAAGRIALPEAFSERVARLARVDAALRGPEDLDPRIGDDDSGRMDLKAQGGEPERKISGAQKLETWLDPRGSVALKASGIYVLRSARLSCHVACGPNGQQGVGGHAHNDKLAIVLRVDGRPLVVERGTWGYSADPAARDRFRSTAMHSTLALDGLEQSRLRDWRKLQDEAGARCRVWSDSETETVFSGEHHGFRPLAAKHRRTLQLDKARHRLFVMDEIEAEEPREAWLFLHLDPSLDRSIVLLRKNRVELPGGWFLFEEGLVPEAIETPHSPIYGMRIAALALRLRISIANRRQIAWEFGAG
ncbi:MAG: alginate lyase family protein [Verrucomicrobiae bacterium]|nr:alginate lyase family protein [Verrucomicrobiae bacterium]